jgi:hypothetical protein
MDIDDNTMRGYIKTALARQAEVGDTFPEETSQCWCCKKFKVLPDFHVEKSILAGEVRDVLCNSCAIEHAKELAPLYRIVCVGCKEVVDVREPGPPQAGFVFERGGIYHIANCARCMKGLKKSQILEMVLFYKRNGIPYE